MSTTSNLTPQQQASYNAESNLSFILGFTVTTHVLALIAVISRVYVRSFIVKVFGMDDYTIVAAMLFAIGGMVTIAIEVPLGLGRHQSTISADNLVKFKFSNFIYSLISAVLAVNLVKISVSFLLMRFVIHRWYKRFLWGMIIFMCAYTIVAWTTVIFYCHPIKAYWDASVRRQPGTKCYPLEAFIKIGLMNTGINISSDVILATLPIPIIWKLQINQRQKIALIGVLSMGYLAVAVGIVKSVFQVTLPTVADQTFQQGIQTWGFVQTNIGIIAACLPALRPLIQYLSDVSIRSRSRAPTHPTNGYIRQTNHSMGRDDEGIHMGDYGKKEETGLEKGNRTLVVGRNKGSWVDLREGSGSEEEILGLGGGIVRTTEFIVK